MTALTLVAVAATVLLLAPPSSRPRTRLTRLALLATAPLSDADPAMTGRASDKPPVALRAGAAALVVVATLVLRVPPLLPLGGLATALCAKRVHCRRRRHRTEAARRAACAEVALALAAELRAGRSTGAALAAVAAVAGPLAPPLAAAARAVAAGATGSAELAEVATLPGCGSLRAVAAAWAVTEQSGGPVADVLERLADGLDAELRAARAVDAALAGPRTTIALLAVLPVGGIALGESMGVSTVHLLLHRPLGWALAGGAATLDAIGVGWTRRLARRALRA